MFKLLIGPVLMGAGYVAGSIYGNQAEQIVHKSPSATYDALKRAVASAPVQGTTSFEGGTPMPYQLQVEGKADERLHLTLLFSGRPGAEADLHVLPQGDGTASLVTARVHADRAVLRAALAGTNKAKLAYAPDWMLNLAAQPVLKQLAQQIERGDEMSIMGSSADVRARAEADMTADERRQLSTWEQYEATRPTVDPNAEAQEYLQGSQSSQ